MILNTEGWRVKEIGHKVLCPYNSGKILWETGGLIGVKILKPTFLRALRVLCCFKKRRK